MSLPECLKKKLNLRQRLQIKNILLYNRMNERRTLGGRKNGSSERAFKSPTVHLVLEIIH